MNESPAGLLPSPVRGGPHVVINILCVALFVSHLPATMARAQSVLNDTQPPGTTLLCRFTDGPRAGRTQPLAGRTDKVAARAGSSCSDGISSTGVVVASQVDAPAPQPALTSTCQFSNGPRAGEIADLSGASAPVPVGSACSDGDRPAELQLLPPRVRRRFRGVVPYKPAQRERKPRSVRFVSSCPAPRLMGGTTMPRCPPRRSAAHVKTA